MIDNGKVTQRGSRFGQDAADFLNGIDIAVSLGLLSPVTGGATYDHVVASATPQNPLSLPSDLKDRVSSIVSNPKGNCAEYITKLLAKVSAKYGEAFSDDASDLFDRIGLAGFKLKKINYAGLSDFNGNRRVVYIKPVSLSAGEDAGVIEHSLNGYAVTALNELMHHARKSGIYTDAQLAYAAFQLLDSDEQLKRRLPKSNDVDANSKYFHSLFNLHCRSTTGE